MIIRIEIATNRHNKIIRNQIEYIIINQNVKTFVKSIKTYPEAEHNPLLIYLRKYGLIKTPKELQPGEQPRMDYWS